jgi:hypothetical protein
LSTAPSALQLRYLQTVTEIASENNSTTIFPIPIEMIRPFIERTVQPAVSKAGSGPAALPAPDPTLPQFKVKEGVRESIGTSPDDDARR